MNELEYDQLPAAVRAALESFDEDKDAYAECTRIESQLRTLGYSVEWGLDGELYDLKKIEA